MLLLQELIMSGCRFGSAVLKKTILLVVVAEAAPSTGHLSASQTELHFSRRKQWEDRVNAAKENVGALLG